ncbi:myeloid cell surface antigen CD33-like isoform X2 [Centroberyx affinis]|uniref:myeloid cell surface antigen CD33-like isoform X2 n=1 Tax=Centroberyx affinis TaxID=166261 RepID=UPI003A5C41C7
MDKQRRMMIFWLLLEAASISSPVVSGQRDTPVFKELKALVTSCVVVPCSFTYPGQNLPSSKLRGIWHLYDDQNQTVYHEERLSITENFRDRTELVGDLGDGNCTLKMIELKNHDNGPFCFRVEIPEKREFSFVESCVRLKMLSKPPDPTLTHTKTAIEGHPYIITCSIMHTCPSNMPTLTWSKESSKDGVIEDHKDNGHGEWETQSILTFIPEEKDDHSEITCTAKFYGGGSSSKTLQLFVKRRENHLYIIVPTAVGVGTAVVFGALCVLMMKKYKRRITELQSSGEGNLWNRLSRLSRRIHSGGPGPFHPEQRSNNVRSTTSGNQTLSKPRFPSPKSQPRFSKYNEDFDDDDADYTNTADLNIYGNL